MLYFFKSSFFLTLFFPSLTMIHAIFKNNLHLGLEAPQKCIQVCAYRSSSGIIAAIVWKTTAAHIDDKTGESQADGAGQQYGGVGPFHHPMKHERLSGDDKF